jgi:Fe-S-cluster-containing dehydrogenase component
MEICPTEGAIYCRDDGLVIIDPNKCNGCRLCIDACTYGSIYFNQNLQIAQKCTGCAHLLDRGWPIKEPRCVDGCGVEALKFGEDSELDLSDTEIFHAEYATKPRVYYKRLPKKFIAGTVFDSSKMEVVVGASCTLTGNGNTFTTTTDDFGDFWFDQLDSGTFSLKIEAGEKTKVIESINDENSVGLGDIALS